MASDQSTATFHIPGITTTNNLRRALMLLEVRYNLSAWLYVERSVDEWRSLTDYFAYTLPSVWHRFNDGSGSGRPLPPFYNPTVNSVEPQDEPDIDARLARMNDFIRDQAIPSTRYELKINSIYQVGSVNVDTSGLGEPLTEVTKSLWSRKERAEARRHTEEMNRREERAADRDFAQQNNENLYANLEKIHGMVAMGVISEKRGQTLMDDLMPVRRAVEHELRSAEIDYVDNSLARIEA